MTTWILAAVLLGSGAAMGYRQGVIRVAFSFVGIITAILLASTVGRMLTPLLKFVLKNPYLQELTGVVVGFILVLAIFKIVGQQTHKHVELHYRDAGEFKRGLWDRLYRRLGMCLGLLNGLLYLVIATAAIYMGSYWSVQISPANADMKAARVLNLLGRDLESTGMSKVAGAVNQLPPAYYEAANVAGLIINNPPVEARLGKYPAFISLQQMPELQRLANDSSFIELMARKPSLAEVVQHPAVKAILNDPAALKRIQDAVEPNLSDLESYLTSGVSAKHNDPILGRWHFDLHGSVAEYRKEKPNMPSSEIARVRALMAGRYARAVLAAGTDQRTFLLDFPRPGATELQSYTGQWNNAGAEYLLNLEGSTDAMRLEVDSTRLNMRWEDIPLVFLKEE